MSVRTSWAVRVSSAMTIPPSRPWAGATTKLVLSRSSLERKYPQRLHFTSILFYFPKIVLVSLFITSCFATFLHNFSIRYFPTDLCATSILVTVDTSISWSVIVTVGNSNTSGSLDPTAKPLRSSPSAEFSSNLLQPLFTHVTLHLLLHSDSRC